jgi:hypothetical protein
VPEDQAGTESDLESWRILTAYPRLPSAHAARSAADAARCADPAAWSPFSIERMPVRAAHSGDLDVIVALSDDKRRQYEGQARIFYRPAPNAAAVHRPWLARLIEDGSVATFVHESDGAEVDGFVIVTLVSPPPVYDPGGPTCSVDDFVVATPSLWASAGRDLLSSASIWGREQGAVQMVVVCGPHDAPKRQMLQEAGLEVASEWFAAPLG